jgi:hypothetical protein
LYVSRDTDGSPGWSTESIAQCLSALETYAPFSGRRGSNGGAAASKTHGGRNSSDGIKAKAELSLLSDLLGAKSSKETADSKPMKLNLFPTPGFGTSKDWDDDDDGYDGSTMIMIDIDASSGAKTVQRYMEDLDLGDSKAEGKMESKFDDDDDLLALMDSAK